MEYVGRGTILGLSFFTGELEGVMQDSGTAHVQVDLDPKHNGKGFRTDAKRCASADVVKKVMHVPLPFEADFSVREVATKGKTSHVITEIKPLKMAAKAA